MKYYSNQLLKSVSLNEGPDSKQKTENYRNLKQWWPMLNSAKQLVKPLPVEDSTLWTIRFKQWNFQAEAENVSCWLVCKLIWEEKLEGTEQARMEKKTSSPVNQTSKG